ncbi:hypothetical protein BG003_011692, partial [Podila horticola]
MKGPVVQSAITTATTTTYRASVPLVMAPLSPSSGCPLRCRPRCHCDFKHNACCHMAITASGSGSVVGTYQCLSSTNTSSTSSASTPASPAAAPAIPAPSDARVAEAID